MWQDQHARHPFNGLEGQGPLPLEFLAAALAPHHERRMPILRLLQNSGGSLHSPLRLLREPANQTVLSLKKLRQ